MKSVIERTFRRGSIWPPALMLLGIVTPARGQGGWTQEAKLTAAENTDDFGVFVSLSGDTVIVSAHGNGSNAAYVFARSGGV